MMETKFDCNKRFTSQFHLCNTNYQIGFVLLYRLVGGCIIAT